MKEKAGNAATLQDNRGVPCNRLPAELEKSQKRKESVLSKKPTCQEKRGAKSKKMALIQQFTFARDGQDFFAVVVDDGCSFHKNTNMFLRTSSESDEHQCCSRNQVDKRSFRGFNPLLGR